MMDLLVNLAAGSRLNPAGHTLQVLNEETGKLKEYKANQTIGSLCTRGDDHRLLGATVQIVPKKDSKKSTHHKNAQPFEVRCLCHPAPPAAQNEVSCGQLQGMTASGENLTASVYNTCI